MWTSWLKSFLRSVYVDFIYSLSVKKSCASSIETGSAIGSKPKGSADVDNRNHE